MLYCVQALHLTQGYSYSKHSAAIAHFGKHFVRTGLFDARFHDYLRKAFEDRHRGDYEAMQDVSEETARIALDRSREFLAATMAFLSREQPE